MGKYGPNRLGKWLRTETREINLGPEITCETPIVLIRDFPGILDILVLGKAVRLRQEKKRAVAQKKNTNTGGI